MAKRGPKPRYNIDELIDMYVNKKLSLPKIAKIENLHHTTIRNALIKHGVSMRSNVDGINLVRHEMNKDKIGKKRNFTEEHNKNISKAKKYKEDSAKLDNRGYSRITTGDNRDKLSHVLIFEEYLGRKIRSNEVVHHIDHNKNNNDIDNLCLLTKSAHSRLHRFEENLCGYKRERDALGRFKGVKEC